MVCGLICFTIKHATSYDAVRIGLSMSTKPKTGREAFSSNLALFTSAIVVFLCFPFQCIFKKCSFSFARANLELLNLASQTCTEDAESHPTL